MQIETTPYDSEIAVDNGVELKYPFLGRVKPTAGVEYIQLSTRTI